MGRRNKRKTSKKETTVKFTGLTVIYELEKKKVRDQMKALVAGEYTGFKDVHLDDLNPMPRLSVLTMDQTVTPTSFLQLGYPQETEKIAAEERMRKLQQTYREFLFPDLYGERQRYTGKMRPDKVEDIHYLEDISPTKPKGRRFFCFCC